MNPVVRDFDQQLAHDELPQIHARRSGQEGTAPREEFSTAHNLTGLGLSGGGIRSAAFCTGVLEALVGHGLYPFVDVLTTVSGGGYIGGCLSGHWGRAGIGKGFPYDGKAANFDPTLSGFLRQECSYLPAWPVLLFRVILSTLVQFATGFVLFGLLFGPWTVIPPLDAPRLLSWIAVHPLTTAILCFSVTALPLSGRAYIQPSMKQPGRIEAPIHFLMTGSIFAGLYFVFLWLFEALKGLPAWFTWFTLGSGVAVYVLAFFGSQQLARLPRSRRLRQFFFWGGAAGLVLLMIGMGCAMFQLLRAWPGWIAGGGTALAPFDIVEENLVDGCVALFALIVVGLLVKLVLRGWRTRGFAASIPEFTTLVAILIPALLHLFGAGHGARLGVGLLALVWAISVVTAVVVFVNATKRGHARVASLVLLLVFAAVAAVFLLGECVSAPGSSFGPASMNVASADAAVRRVQGFSYLLLVMLAVGASLVVGPNTTSHHDLYRHGLRSTFLTDPVTRAPLADENGGGPILARLMANARQGGPVHVLQAAVPLRRRPGDATGRLVFEPFLFTGAAWGARSLGLVTPDRARLEGFEDELAAAMAVSGAAVSSHMPGAWGRLLAPVFSLLNVRLGVWLPNPAWLAQDRVPRLAQRPPGLLYYVKEIFSEFDSSSWRVLVSDGGHYENLGLGELVRRRCRFIVLSDAGYDPDFRFEDLDRAREICRREHGCEIEFDQESFNRMLVSGKSRGWAWGRLHYGSAESDRGVIVYVKACRPPGMPKEAEIYGAEYENFPHEGTSDQYFSTAQFDAYRQLGNSIAAGAAGARGWSSFEAWLEWLQRQSRT